MKILVVEDSERVRHSLVKLISQLCTNCEITEMVNVDETKKLLNNDVFDLSILDLNLPDGSGVELIKLLKRSAKSKVIIFSNTTSIYIREKCSLLGADHFFDKSTEFDKLVSTLEDLQPIM